MPRSSCASCRCPSPWPGQVLLRVRAASLNRGDLLGAIAFHRAPQGRPAGVDAAGEVHAVGEGVKDLRLGDRIMARARGCFAEYVLGRSRARDADPAAPLVGTGGGDSDFVRHGVGSARSVRPAKAGEWLLSRARRRASASRRSSSAKFSAPT